MVKFEKWPEVLFFFAAVILIGWALWPCSPLEDESCMEVPEAPIVVELDCYRVLSYPGTAVQCRYPVVTGNMTHVRPITARSLSGEPSLANRLLVWEMTADADELAAWHRRIGSRIRRACY